MKDYVQQQQVNETTEWKIPRYHKAVKRYAQLEVDVSEFLFIGFI